MNKSVPQLLREGNYMGGVAIQFDERYHQYRVNGKYVPSVTTILKEMGFYDCYEHGDDTRKNFYMNRGKAVHKATELFDREELDMGSVHKSILPYLEGWQKFCNMFKPIFHEIEVPCASSKMEYAGTIDRVCMIKGYPYIIDIKCSKTLIPANKLQLEAYKLAWKEMNGESNYHRAVVRLLGDGDFKFDLFQDAIDSTGWMGTLALRKWKLKEGLICQEPIKKTN